MGDKQSKSKSNNCYITKDGEHVDRGDIIRAGAADARLNDDESPSKIVESIIGFTEAKDINWNATPDNIDRPCDEHN